MFRTVKKKKLRGISPVDGSIGSQRVELPLHTRSTKEDEEEEGNDEPSNDNDRDSRLLNVINRLKQKKSKRQPKQQQQQSSLHQLSFHDDHHDKDDDNDDFLNIGSGSGIGIGIGINRSTVKDIDNDDEKSMKITRKSRKQQKRMRTNTTSFTGMGFGGAVLKPSHGEDGHRDNNNSNNNNNNNDDDGSDNNKDDHHRNLYSKDSLSKLRNEQKQQQQQQVDAAAAAARPMDTDDTILHKLDPAETTAEFTTFVGATTTTHGPTLATEKEEEEDDYIPLRQHDTTANHGNVDEILTGDDALAYLQRTNDDMDDGDDDDDENENTNVRNDDDDGDAWETEVIRRAGLKDSLATQTSGTGVGVAVTESHNQDHNDNKNDSGNVENDNENNPTALLNQLRAQIVTTMESIQYNQNNLERQNQRRYNEIQTNQELLLQHQQTIQTVGTKYEFYQTWRNEYMIWMGAIHQELQPKIESIMRSLHALEQDVAATARTNEYYDHDVIIVLREQQQQHDISVDQTIGTLEHVHQLSKEVQINKSLTSGAGTVDEFGRSIVSQSKMQREKRRMQRRRIVEQRRNHNIDTTFEETTIVVDNSRRNDDGDGDRDSPSVNNILCGDESDGLISETEVEAFRERHEALQGALMVAMNEIHEDYVTLHRLISFFTEWYEKFPDEYSASHASNSFIDLAAVLIQAELCSLNDPWNESGGYNESKWITSIHMAMNHNRILETVHIERLFAKCIVPTISDLILSNRGVNIQSSRQTRSLHKFIIHLQKLLPTTNLEWMKLMNLLKTYITFVLDDVTIVIFNYKDRVTTAAVAVQSDVSETIRNSTTNHRTEEYDEALYSASWGQMYRMRKMLRNVFQYWVPMLQSESEFRTILLKFICNKYIRLVISVQSIERLWQDNSISETPADFFNQIHASLVQTGWLDLPEHAAANTIVQAAMIVFQV